jgi:hypothetical protein
MMTTDNTTPNLTILIPIYIELAEVKHYANHSKNHQGGNQMLKQ